MLVKGRRFFIFSVNHHRVGGDLRVSRSIHGIRQQRTAKSQHLEILIDRQASHAHRWHQWIARQFLPMPDGRSFNNMLAAA